MTVVFDLGGVLIDWDPRYLYRKLFNGNDAEMTFLLSNICSPEWNAQQDAGRPFSEAIAELSTKHPEYERLITAYFTRWQEMVSGAIQSTVDILAELRQAQYSLVALSNWSAETFPLVQRRFDFLSWFETILLSGEVKLKKPDERIYQALLPRIGRTAQECVFIDDTEQNIATAGRLGFHAIHYQSPDQLRNELSRLGVLPGR